MIRFDFNTVKVKENICIKKIRLSFEVYIDSLRPIFSVIDGCFQSSKSLFTIYLYKQQVFVETL